MEHIMSNLQDAIRIDTDELLPSKTTDAYWLGAECKPVKLRIVVHLF